jgi:O-antigen/teichoic acid export membrane protein
LGLYQLAYKVSILPISEISEVVSRVVFPVYTKIADDRARLYSAFVKTIMSVSATALGVSVIIFLFPEQIITILLGSQWIAAVPALKVLAFYGAVRTLSGPTSALFLSVGKQNYVTAMTFARFAGLALTIYPLVRFYGLVGAGYSALFSAIIELPVMFYFAAQILTKKQKGRK